MNAAKSFFAVGALCAASAFGLAVHAQTPDMTEVVEQATSQVPAAMAVLVPDDATVFAMTSSLDDIESIAAALVGEIQPAMAGMINLDLLLLQMADILPPDFDADAIDRTKPIGFAVGALQMMIPPQVIVMVPTNNPEAIEALLPEGPMPFSTRVSGGYLAITLGNEFPDSTGSSELIERMPPGLIGLTVDLDSTFEAYGPLIEGGMQSFRAQMQQLSEMMGDFAEDGESSIDYVALADVYLGFAEDALDSLTGLNLSLVSDGPLLDLRCEMLVDEGSPMSNAAADGPSSLSQSMHLLTDAPLSTAIGADMGKLLASYANMMQSMSSVYPGGMGEAMTASLQILSKRVDLLGDTVVSAMKVTEQGAQFTGYFDGSQFEAFLATYESFARDPMLADLGLAHKGTVKAELDGVEITRITYDYDIQKILDMAGPDLSDEEELEEVTAMLRHIYGEQMVFTLAKSGETGIAILGGGDQALRDAIAHLRAKPAMLPDVQRLQGLAATCNPFISYRANLGMLVQNLIPLISPSGIDKPSEMHAVANSGVYFNNYLGITKTSWTWGLMIDAVEAGRLAMEIAMNSGR